MISTPTPNGGIINKLYALMMCWAITFDFVLNLTITHLMPPNLLVNVNNLDVVKEGVAWAFDENLNKFEWFIKFCKRELY
jgi:hypothetical protein